MKQLVVGKDFILDRENFPLYQDEWDRLLCEEGMEIRGKPMQLAVGRYYEMERNGRLVFIAARDCDHYPIGYASGYWYTDLHWSNRVAVDDLWYVKPEWRRRGVGLALKDLLHKTLKGLGATLVAETIRLEFKNDQIMMTQGYRKWGIRWVKEL